MSLLRLPPTRLGPVLGLFGAALMVAATIAAAWMERARLAGGRAEFEVEPGVGTMFRITLPTQPA